MKTADKWEDNASYQLAKERCSKIQVINDSAERGVKLDQDFLLAAKKEDHYQNVLQVVEKDRKNRSSYRKKIKIEQ